VTTQKKPLIVPRLPGDNFAAINRLVETGGKDDGTGEQAPEAAPKKERAAQTRRLTVYVPKALLRKLKLRCVHDELTLSDAAAEALSAWLEKRPNN